MATMKMSTWWWCRLIKVDPVIILSSSYFERWFFFNSHLPRVGGPLARSKFWSHCTENSSKEPSLLRILVNLSNPLNWQLTNNSKFNLWVRIQSWTQAVLFVYGSIFYNHYNLQISQNKAITIITWTLPSCHSATSDTFPSAAAD